MKISTPKKKTSAKTTTFRSGFEKNIAANLDLREVPYEYESERISYQVTRQYKPDFKLANGIYVEAKGYFQSDDQRKMRLLKEQYPDKEFRMLFMNASGKCQGSKMTNAQWCERYGFVYAEGVSVPEEWINESNSNS